MMHSGTPPQPSSLSYSLSPSPPPSSWIHLKDPKSFSRLLYPNPVCFLCTTSTLDPESASPAAAAVATSKSYNNDASPSSTQKSVIAGNVMVVSWLTASNNNGKFVMSINKRRHTAQILTECWRESTSQQPSKSSSSSSPSFFTLCVPTAGMEKIVLAVGGISGRIGSKFDRTLRRQRQQRNCNKNTNNDSNNEIGMYPPSSPPAPAPAPEPTVPTLALPASSQMVPSKRQQKKQRLEDFTMFGIPGLHSVPYGFDVVGEEEEEGGGGGEEEKIGTTDRVDRDEDSTNNATVDPTNSNRTNNHFCIEGTVAHMLCRIDQILQQQHCNDNKTHTATSIDAVDMTDNDHYLVSATIIDAFVREDYFDVETKQFCARSCSADHKNQTAPTGTSIRTNTSTTNTKHPPQPPPPFLTFLGSQTFGYVVSQGR